MGKHRGVAGKGWSPGCAPCWGELGSTGLSPGVTRQHLRHSGAEQVSPPKKIYPYFLLSLCLTFGKPEPCSARMKSRRRGIKKKKIRKEKEGGREGERGNSVPEIRGRRAFVGHPASITLGQACCLRSARSGKGVTRPPVNKPGQTDGQMDRRTDPPTTPKTLIPSPAI